jgi:hypothetical protein
MIPARSASRRLGVGAMDAAAAAAGAAGDAGGSGVSAPLVAGPGAITVGSAAVAGGALSVALDAATLDSSGTTGGGVAGETAGPGFGALVLPSGRSRRSVGPGRRDSTASGTLGPGVRASKGCVAPSGAAAERLPRSGRAVGFAVATSAGKVSRGPADGSADGADAPACVSLRSTTRTPGLLATSGAAGRAAIHSATSAVAPVVEAATARRRTRRRRWCRIRTVERWTSPSSVTASRLSGSSVSAASQAAAAPSRSSRAKAARAASRCSATCCTRRSDDRPPGVRSGMTARLSR